ncbi:sulfate ABC transporter [Mycobacteroides abscessus subsp. abscessus]|uniref:SulP family inorganic anion transporter n=1 Tax=Mycobacteroides abscessus TaxID=36809 RepID=UPI00092CAB2F|nr:sulfate permease [Mycobacteroides abscessus]SHU37455.1 sulfate ABC transporter [Mycobacteroides abscessus subsp. abscessus]SHW01302.1 sulfate ABC transporter [Mycobacteroides abscessus subsp. abscessus]SIH24103.1 sulfate ABC transporter [Mycobacteroides abscessus subsp. abscessus]SIK52991.1 sulfate ABC transporter [Mycobacteroides abscessus subsp. abscessus]SKD16694.1 sulfate ABC transporter [Mycobacteroides abscessus subsp. abscessus]
MTRVMGWRNFAPGLALLTDYRRTWLRGDVLAGITVAAYLVPQVMAYAALAGLPPVSGLWASLAPLVIYAFLGSSRHLSVGPESTTALMTAIVLAPLASGDPGRYAALAATLALLVGVVCLAAGLVKLGVLANLLSHPVLVGYMGGVGITMAGSQISAITGTKNSGDDFIAQVKSLAGQFEHIRWPTLVLAASALALLAALGRWAPRMPGPLAAVAVATVAVSALPSANSGFALVGQVPAGLPIPGVPHVDSGQLGTLVMPAMGVAVVAFSDNILTARAFATHRNEDINANAELRALGLCNMGSGFMQGFPVSSSGSRTALGDSTGCRSQLFSLIAFVFVLIVLLLAHGALSLVPRAALGALVVYAAIKLVNVSEYRRFARFRRLALSTTLAVLGLGVLYGILAAVALSILDLLHRVAHPHDGVLGFVPGVPGMHDIDDYPNASPVPGLVVYRYDAPLCFANAEDFRRRAMSAVTTAGEPVEWFILSAEANVDVDLTALDALDRLRKDLSDKGIVFVMARVKQDLRDALDAADLLPQIGETRIFVTLPTAIDAFRARHGDIKT